VRQDLADRLRPSGYAVSMAVNFTGDRRWAL
jgi:predicted Co/Zn/Cd cation transporter (cation efflux family)